MGAMLDKVFWWSLKVSVCLQTLLCKSPCDERTLCRVNVQAGLPACALLRLLTLKTCTQGVLSFLFGHIALLMELERVQHK